eukprot:3681145-Pleurochrysis_carterae.AAC.1
MLVRSEKALRAGRLPQLSEVELLAVSFTFWRAFVRALILHASRSHSWLRNKVRDESATCCASNVT